MIINIYRLKLISAWVLLSVLGENSITKMEKTDLTEPERICTSKCWYLNPENSVLLVPSNKAEIIIPLDCQHLEVKMIGNARTTILKGSSPYFVPPRGRGLELTSTVDCSCLVIEVEPLLTTAFLESSNRLSNNIHELEMFGEHELESLIARCMIQDDDSIAQLIKEAIQYDSIELNNTVRDSVAMIRESRGMLPIKDIYQTLEISKSKLEQHFNKEFGLTPKEYSKIEKLTFFINTYFENESQNLTELTYQCGYYDQSHLIKDFRYFLSTSPKRFLNSYTNHLQLA
ncbi:MAG: hypothetical protein Tsb0034_26350 [Ekhidna sp.]